MKMKSLSDKQRTCKCGKTNQEVEFRNRSNQCKECYRKLIQKHNLKRRSKENITQPFDWIWNNNI
jgi:hypothetical protein